MSVDEGILTDLTASQVQVLRLAAEGHTAEKSAELLQTSFRSVRNHREQLCQRLGARNMAHAVAIGLRRGLIA